MKLVCAVKNRNPRGRCDRRSRYTARPLRRPAPQPCPTPRVPAPDPSTAASRDQAGRPGVGRRPYGGWSTRTVQEWTVRRPCGGRADRAARRHSYNCAATWLLRSCSDRAGRRAVLGGQACLLYACILAASLTACSTHCARADRCWRPRGPCRRSRELQTAGRTTPVAVEVPGGRAC